MSHGEPSCGCMMEDGSGLVGVPRLEPGLNCKGNCRRFWPASAGAAVDFVVEFGEDDSAGGARESDRHCCHGQGEEWRGRGIQGRCCCREGHRLNAAA